MSRCLASTSIWRISLVKESHHKTVHFGSLIVKVGDLMGTKKLFAFMYDNFFVSSSGKHRSKILKQKSLVCYLNVMV